MENYSLDIRNVDIVDRKELQEKQTSRLSACQELMKDYKKEEK